MFKQIVVVSVFILAAGCSLQKSESLPLDPSAPQDGQGSQTTPQPGRDPLLSNEELLKLKVSELSYHVINQQVLLDRCVGCHSQAGGNRGDVNLETYEKVFEFKEQIRAEVFAGTMPPKRRPELKLSEGQIKVILDWIDNGAKKEKEPLTQPPAPPPAEPPVVQPPIQPPVQPPVEPPPVTQPPPQPPVEQEVFFAEVMEKVIKTNCLKCHSQAGGNRGDVNLETYENVFENRDAIFDDVDFGTMPPKPSRGTPLTDEQKKLILDWIKKGAPEKAP